MKKLFLQKIAILKVSCIVTLIILCLGYSMVFPSIGVAEGLPCSPEPTEMNISYGDLINCSIDIAGDVDDFYFFGETGESIVIIAASKSSVRTCIELVAPDDTRTVSCENSFSDRIDTTLNQTGTYTIHFKEAFDYFTGEYALSIERVVPPSPNAQSIQYGETIVDEINTYGDVDLYYFNGTAGESIVIIGTSNSSVRTCLELIAPDNSRTVSCENAFSARIDTTLNQTGIYTILFKETFDYFTGEYALSIERVVPPSPNVQLIQYGETLTDEINPFGDLDLFYFKGTAGDTIKIEAVSNSSVRTCLELIAPDNSRTVACENAFSARINITLDQTGTYTILFKETFDSYTGSYKISIQCSDGACVVTPVPDIKANGFDGPITIRTADTLSITINLNPESRSGENADWWALANTPFGWYRYNVSTDSWQPGQTVTYQGPLFNLSPYQILNMSGLPVGSYTFYFGVDMNMNGALDMGQMYYDSVKVNIQ